MRSDRLGRRHYRGGVGPWIAIIVIVAGALAATVVVLARGRRATPTVPDPAPAARTVAAPASSPMTDLESALAQVTDRDGRPIKERIEAESVPSRDPDDTGPLLRRALDSVAHHEVDPPTGGRDTPGSGA